LKVAIYKNVVIEIDCINVVFSLLLCAFVSSIFWMLPFWGPCCFPPLFLVSLWLLFPILALFFASWRCFFRYLIGFVGSSAGADGMPKSLLRLMATIIKFLLWKV
jgi:hypothetical protein